MKQNLVLLIETLQSEFLQKMEHPNGNNVEWEKKSLKTAMAIAIKFTNMS